MGWHYQLRTHNVNLFDRDCQASTVIQLLFMRLPRNMNKKILNDEIASLAPNKANKKNEQKNGSGSFFN